MGKSPGHQQWPEHKVVETEAHERVKVSINDHVVADSRQAIRLDEDGARSRYYLPREDVLEDCLARVAATTHCPFKGTASYFDIHLDGKSYQQAAWSYESTYEEHRALAGRIAFDDDRHPALKIEAIA